MKKLLLIGTLLILTAGAFASIEFYLANEDESWGCCYITEENQAEWDAENARIEAALENPELWCIFELLNQASEE